MLAPTVCREWNGIYIEGQQIGLRVHPRAEGTIQVDVIALVEITGFARGCRVSGDEHLEFAPGDITVHDTRLECFSADSLVPFLRKGFTLDLEPGMAQVLRDWLPKIFRVAAAAKAVADIFSEQLPPPIYHMLDAITAVVKRVVTAGFTVDHSVAYERSHGVWRENHAFMRLFDNERVRLELDALVQPAAAPAPELVR